MGTCAQVPFSMTRLVILTLNFLNSVRAISEVHYTKYPGYKLGSPCISGVKSARSMLQCAEKCSRTSTCVSGSYTSSNGLCCISNKLIYQDGVTFAQDAGSVYFQTKAEHVRHGNWVLVFRASSEIGQLVYGEYVSSTKFHDSPVGGASAAISCWSLSGSHSCPLHLRSSLLNQWANGALNVQKVKFSFYKNGAEEVNIIFNGVGSSFTDWFQVSKVLSSTYTDLTTTQTYNEFGLFGFDNGGTLRRFYVSRTHGGCEVDTGWVAVVERADCSWETLGAPYPYFLYSPTMSFTIWHTSVAKADVMAVFVEL